jgi:pilus assembly protein CpaB
VTNKMALIVAVILGVLSIIGIRSYVEQVKTAGIRNQAKIPFLVVIQELQPGHVLAEDDLEERPFNKETMEGALRGSFISPGEKQAYLGARLRAKLKPGQVLLKDHFADSGPQATADDPSAKLKADERMMTIPVNVVSGLDGLLRPGDFVDVIVTMDMTQRNGDTFPITRTLLKSKPIIATAANTSRYAVIGSRNLYETITLRVNFKEANRLAFCLAQGASFHLTKMKEGTGAHAGHAPVITDHIYSDISTELRSGRPGRR